MPPDTENRNSRGSLIVGEESSANRNSRGSLIVGQGQNNGLPPEMRDSGPQRIRNMLQGMTFNTMDEMEGFVTSMVTDKTYDEAVKDVRDKIKSSQTMHPGSALSHEMAGAFIPAVVAMIATRGKTKPKAFNSENASRLFANYFPRTARVIGIGTAQGTAAHLGRGEGGLPERAENVGGAASVSAATTAALDLGMRGAGRGLTGLVNLFRNTAGSRVSQDVVKREIQRLARENNISPDDAADMLRRGEILSDVPGISEELGAMRAQGGLDDVFEPLRTRPARTRDVARETIEEGLSPGGRVSSKGIAGDMDTNTQRIARGTDEELRLETKRAYDEGVKIETATPKVQTEMRDVLIRSDSTITKINQAYKSQSGKDPFFTFNRQSGEINFVREPTNMEAEYLRRIIAEEADDLISKGGAGSEIGINLAEAANRLKSAIDEAFPTITTARAASASQKAVQQAFKDGKKVVSMAGNKLDEAQLIWQDLLDAGDERAIESFRLGYLASLKGRMRSGNKASVVRQLAGEEPQGDFFREVFPEDLLDDALQKLEIADRAAWSGRKIFTGSDTAARLNRPQRHGRFSETVTTGQLAGRAAAGDALAVTNILERMINAFKPRMSDRQRQRVVEILVSENPELVADALNNPTVMRRLQIMLANAIDSPIAGALESATASTIATPMVFDRSGEQ